MKIMSELLNTVKKVFANQMSTPKASAAFSAQLSALDAPAPGVKKAEIILPVVVAPTPAPVVAPVVIQQPVAATHTKELCPHCNQPMPIKPAPVVSDPNDPNMRPIDWTEEQRTDLPMRTPARIQYLLKFETMEQTRARIENDARRYRHQRALEGLL